MLVGQPILVVVPSQLLFEILTPQMSSVSTNVSVIVHDVYSECE